MIITICPRCGSMNVTTTCTKCGWSQFAQVTTVSTKITGEIEIMLSGKALLDDYKRLLLENRNLKERIAELEKDNDEFRQLIHDWIIILTPDDGYVPDSECVRQAMLVIDKEREG